MKLSDFQYDLPKELIAQYPLKERDASKLLVLDRSSRNIEEKQFTSIVDHLDKGDCLVLNNTRVVNVRLLGKRKTGGKVEIFLLNPLGEKLEALVKPSGRVKDGETIELEGGNTATVFGRAGTGRVVEFDATVEDVLKNGHVPLPPYIDRSDDVGDISQYQTVYAICDGATAAPTAGLHFTPGLLQKIRSSGIKVVYVTLHTGYGTFAPVKEELIEDHKMHSEWYSISKETVDEINETRRAGGKVCAVGTTSARVLESVVNDKGDVYESTGETELFIFPGFRFKIVDKLITNFHLPGSTLLMLVSALAGKEFIFEAYEKAKESGFRFFSYGDAMIIE
jgi:S-adenosylmethionine:tRNA ribosyltransferase-isomerase